MKINIKFLRQYIWIILFGLLINILSCGKSIPSPKYKANPNDEKALIASIQKRINCAKNHEHDTAYHDYSNQYHGLRNIDIKAIYVDNTLYSPDSLFLFSFILIQSKQNSTLYPYVYDGIAEMGYRIRKDTLWSFYPIEHCEGTDDTYKRTLKILINCYYKTLKNSTDPNGDSFKVNANDPSFWSESLYFTKLLDGKFYYFQCSREIYNGIKSYVPYDYSKCD
jgi:hypothetical protein